jgi:hypothetical protein
VTPAEFRDLVSNSTDAQLLDPCLRDEATPFVFEAKPESWDLFRNGLSARLGANPGDVRVIGSGRFGFSMKPWKNLRSYQDTSDIDVLIVNSALFDELWLALLQAAYPRGSMPTRLGGWLQARRNELYTGWLTPLAVKLDVTIVGPKGQPVIDFNRRWFNAMKEAGRHPVRRHENISSRLYRTWGHAELYHLDSLAALRKTLAP